MWLTKLRSSAPGRALRHRNFRLFITGNLVSLLGTRIHEIAAGWLVWTLTESATWLGALAIAQTLPRILLWPIAGVLADRMDRRRMAFIFQSIAFLGAGSLAVVNALELIQVWMIVLVHAVLGVCQGFWQPSRMALLSQVVPREDMTPAVALNSVGAQSSRILGPALAGLIIIYAGPTTAFAVNAFTFLAVIGALSLMTLAPGRASRAVRTGMIRESLDGMRYIANHPGIGPLILIVLIFCVSVRPIIDLFPAFADVNFARGAGGLSALNAMLGLGAVLGGIWASWRSGLRGLTALLAWSSGVGGAATLLFALTDSFPFALVCVVFSGWGIVLLGIVSQTLIQTAVDDAVRGRVFSVYGMIFGASPGIGTFVMGWAGDRIGLHVPVAIGGGIAMLLCVYIFIRRRQLAAILEAPAEPAAPAKPQ